MKTNVICPNCNTEFLVGFSHKKWLYDVEKYGMTTMYLKEGFSETCPHCKETHTGQCKFEIPPFHGTVGPSLSAQQINQAECLPHTDSRVEWDDENLTTTDGDFA